MNKIQQKNTSFQFLQPTQQQQESVNINPQMLNTSSNQLQQLQPQFQNCLINQQLFNSYPQNPYDTAKKAYNQQLFQQILLQNQQNNRQFWESFKQNDPLLKLPLYQQNRVQGNNNCFFGNNQNLLSQESQLNQNQLIGGLQKQTSSKIIFKKDNKNRISSNLKKNYRRDIMRFIIQQLSFDKNNQQVFQEICDKFNLDMLKFQLILKFNFYIFFISICREYLDKSHIGINFFEKFLHNEYNTQTKAFKEFSKTVLMSYNFLDYIINKKKKKHQTNYPKLQIFLENLLEFLENDQIQCMSQGLLLNLRFYQNQLDYSSLFLNYARDFQFKL